MQKTLYMVIEHFKNKDAVAVYRRFRDKGRMAPEGLFSGSRLAYKAGLVATVIATIRVMFPIIPTAEFQTDPLTACNVRQRPTGANKKGHPFQGSPSSFERAS